MSARITEAADAKVSQTQHPSSSNNSIPMPNRRRIRISKQPEMKTPGRKSERFKQPNKLSVDGIKRNGDEQKGKAGTMVNYRPRRQWRATT